MSAEEQNVKPFQLITLCLDTCFTQQILYTDLKTAQTLPPICVKAFQHSPRKIVSATQPPGGFSFATKHHEDVRITTPTTDQSAGETCFRNRNEGRANETTTSSPLRHISSGGNTDGGSGGGGGGGNGDRIGPDDVFDSSNERVGADEASAMNAWRDERDRHIQTWHENKQRRQQQPEHHRARKDNTGVTRWNFYDRSNIAFRSRRLFAAYRGTGIGDAGGGAVSPRRAGNARSAKVTRFDIFARFSEVNMSTPTLWSHRGTGDILPCAR